MERKWNDYFFFLAKQNKARGRARWEGSARRGCRSALQIWCEELKMRFKGPAPSVDGRECGDGGKLLEEEGERVR